MRTPSPAASVLVVSVACLLASCTTGAAYTVYTENDKYAVGNRDRYYTNGLRVTGLYRAADTPEELSALAAAVPSVSERSITQIGWVAGQDTYTPSDTDRRTPDPADRPYAGWLYLGVLVSKAEHAAGGPIGDDVHVLEVDVGVVGPPSHAAQTQVSFHHLIGVSRPQGWRHQLRYEPGIDVQYEYRRRMDAGTAALGGDWDLLGTCGAALGNIYGHVEAGAMVRWGTDLGRDFGPSTIHSTAVNVPDGERTGAPRGYVFAGLGARAVGWNLFLDGNTFRDSPSVDSSPLVGELRAGFAFEWECLRLAFTHVLRSPEFDGQDGSQAYGSIALTWECGF